MIEFDENEVLWEEKYRPRKIADVIMPKALQSIFAGYVQDGLIPNCTLAGGPGIGKTTIAEAMLMEMDADFYKINGSLDAGIGDLRTNIREFATSVSFTGRRKYLLLDEADGLNSNHIQPALRGFIQDYSQNCGFILTVNYEAHLLAPLKSRCPVIDCNFAEKDSNDLIKRFYKRMTEILENENVTYDPEVLGEVILRYYPDFRLTINRIQHYAKGGTLDTGVLTIQNDESVRQLFALMKKQDIKAVRQWAADNAHSSKQIFGRLYRLSEDYLKQGSVAQLAVILNKYDYQAGFVADQELNLTAALMETMVESEFV